MRRSVGEPQVLIKSRIEDTSEKLAVLRGAGEPKEPQDVNAVSFISSGIPNPGRSITAAKVAQFFTLRSPEFSSPALDRCLSANSFLIQGGALGRPHVFRFHH